MNEYHISAEAHDKKKKHFKAEYEDHNLADFNNFIVGNFRRQTTFSYLSWQIINKLKDKQCSMLDFKKNFVFELC